MTDGSRQGAQASTRGVDLGLLDAAGEAIAAGPGLSHMRTMAVFRDEELVFSRCFGPGALDAPVEVHSITKSVLSTLFGIAQDLGVLPSLDVPVARYVPAGPGELPPALTLRHLLTMTRGTAVGGSADMDVVMEDPGPWLPAILGAQRLDEPGTTFRYDNAAAHLAALALDAALGDGLARLARECLFAPLGITDYDWVTDSQGVPRGDWGVVISTMNLARLGELYRQGGTWRGIRIVSEAHVAAATTPVTRGGPPEQEAYGLLWWVEPDGTSPGFFAGGHAGQLLQVVPDLGLVVVLTGEEEALQDGARSGRPVVREMVVPAFLG